MTFDGGWGYILSTVIGVVLVWIGNMVARHFDHSMDDAEAASDVANAAMERASENEKQLLRYQAYVAEHFCQKNDQRDFEKAVFKKLDDIVALINTKADKE
jgi:N-acetylglucosamine kinase-like BadF-type ATPase